MQQLSSHTKTPTNPTKPTQIPQTRHTLPFSTPNPTPTPPKNPLKFNRQNILRKQKLQLTDIYQIQQKIGSGAFSEVFKIRHRELDLVRALKIIKKNQKIVPGTVEDQLRILKELDHPTVLRVFQYFENQGQWQIVSEYFQGRELFQLISAQKFISQRKAATIFAQICKALAYIHSHDIVHRDLKPQNILVKKTSEGQYVVKLIDWGLGSKAVKELIRKCGTPEYCAPEIVLGSYGKECDLWSLGVVLFVMLVGKFPFKGKTASETLALVMKGQVNLKTPYWNTISTDAKILLSKLLQKDPKKRIKASQCLQQPWVLNNLSSPSSPCSQINLIETLQNLQQVNYDNKFQAVVINLIHNYLRNSKQEIRLKREFQQLDVNKDGVLSFQEIKQAYERVYSPLQAQQITQQIFTKIDLDKSNYLQYNQFLTFGTKITSDFTKAELREVFNKFDEDYDGLINKNQLNNLISYEKLSELQYFNALIQEIDQNGDGMIDIEELVSNVGKFVGRVLGKGTEAGREKEKEQARTGEQGQGNKGGQATVKDMFFWEDFVCYMLESAKSVKQVSTFTHFCDKEEKQQPSDKHQQHDQAK